MSSGEEVEAVTADITGPPGYERIDETIGLQTRTEPQMFVVALKFISLFEKQIKFTSTEWVILKLVSRACNKQVDELTFTWIAKYSTACYSQSRSLLQPNIIRKTTWKGKCPFTKGKWEIGISKSMS